MTRPRLAALGAAWGLNDGQVAALGRFVELLATDPLAPTAVRDVEQSLDVHLADSLSGLDVAALRSAESAVDVGSGAGLPGLPLAVALPWCEMVLLESQRRRCDFLERAVAASGAERARVVCARAEDWHAGIGRADAATARALAPQPVVLEWAAPLLRVGGVLVDWRGARRADEERRAGAAAAELGFGAAEVRRVAPFAGARDHHLHVFTKLAPTPERFPRRAGVARKRPLG
ncbi:MAG TPA: 16S rRNA (guanine(527)-N(7))-methyltransferase RsmG [Solirubrobacteraceae bacterium]|nr:16S rRNA (guanine(527)-N(7))-methyltransferase RsmG [Solirubrobacteraceae bacterium]